MIVKLAFRNLFRNRRRSLLTAMMMMAGFIVMSFAIALSEGGYANVIQLFTKLKTGHAIILADGYLENPSIYKVVKDSDKKIEAIRSLPEVKAVTARVEGGALLSYKVNTVGAQIFGVDIENEPKVTSIKSRIKEGEWLSKDLGYGVVIGSSIANTLKVSLGGKIIAISQGFDGSTSNDFFMVKAILKKNSLDDYAIYTDISSAQDFFSLGSNVHRIVAVADYYDQSADLKKSIEDKLQLRDGESVQTWDVVEGDFYKAMTADKEGIVVMYIIMGVVVALGVLNTVLMSLLERKKEFGIMRAIGTKPKQLFLMILTESSLLALVSCVVAGLISLWLNWHFSVEGIKFASPMEVGGIYISEMKTYVAWKPFLIPFYIVFWSSLLVSTIPAYRASKVDISDAMRGL